MKFGPVSLADADGAFLAHSLRIEGRRIAKGTVLTEDLLAAIRAAGYKDVTVARLEPGDLNEDQAAAAVAGMIETPGLSAQPAARGRANLTADADGLLEIDTAAVRAINDVDEAVTLATMPPWTRLRAGETAASVKIITFGVGASVMSTLEATAAAEAPLRLHPFRPLTAVLILTEQPNGDRTAVLRKSTTVVQAHLDGIGATLQQTETTTHDVDSVATLLRAFGGDVDLILILGASSTVDRRDVAPAALEAAGGTVVHLGLPVDPGNLTMVGRLDDSWVLGLPGSARSPRYHGFDLLLQRTAAGLNITSDDIRELAVGGLLKSLPLARTEAQPAADTVKVGAVLLAAGASSRMGNRNKLLEDVDGEPLVKRTARTLAGANLGPIVAVTGHDANAVGRALRGLPLECVHNPHYADGLSTSLAAGLAALPDDCGGILICLADMPDLSTDLVNRLVSAFRPGGEPTIVTPVHQGKRGNPVLFDSRYRTEMTAITGDAGARDIIRAHPDRIVEVRVDTPEILTDLDTPEAWREWRRARQERGNES